MLYNSHLFSQVFSLLRKRGAVHVTGSNRCDTRYVSGVYGSKNIKGLEAYDARMQLRVLKSLPPGSTFSMPDSKQVVLFCFSLCILMKWSGAITMTAHENYFHNVFEICYFSFSS